MQDEVNTKVVAIIIKGGKISAEVLKKALDELIDLLNPGGRFCIITFHSLEDRIVKQFFQDMAALCKCPPGCPVCICNWKPKLKILTRKPVTAEADERRDNPRAACAKLRAAEKTEETL